jgi:hypothetical protein
LNGVIFLFWLLLRLHTHRNEHGYQAGNYFFHNAEINV